MSKLIQTLSKKWTEYIIESLVIEASILGAFALDNWNEDRKNKILEKQNVIRLIEDLKRIQ